MPNVLIAPLDWGLGHATRCIPLIEQFRQQGWDITLAAEGPVADLLRKDFPDMTILPIKGYRIRYGKSSIWWHIIKQFPAISRSIQYENNWLKQHYEKHRWDVIVSDNRPGFYHPQAMNIYITHQLNIKSGLGSWTDWIATRLHRHYIRNFSMIWVPDRADSVLSGELSKSTASSVPVNYIGPLSRISPKQANDFLYDILFVLSGPEPQRSLFEEKILSQIKPSHGRIALIRGTTEKIITETIPENVSYIDLADGAEVARWMNDAELIICRSGYSSLMDLMRLSKRALLVPTPGQGEQEYLAGWADEQGFFPFMTQHDFDLDQALNKVSKQVFSFPFASSDFDQHHSVIDDLTKNQRLD